MGTLDLLFSVGEVQIECGPPLIVCLMRSFGKPMQSLPGKGSVCPCLQRESQHHTTDRDRPWVPSDRAVSRSAGFIKNMKCLFNPAISSSLSLLSPIPIFFMALHRLLSVSLFPVSFGGHHKGRAMLYVAICFTLPLPFSHVLSPCSLPSLFPHGTSSRPHCFPFPGLRWFPL